MLHGVFSAGPWLVETWERSRAGGATSRDAVLVDPRPGALRVAVIDGVTPTAATPRFAGVDGAVWAAAVVRAALLARRPLPACAAAAHDALRATGQPPCSRDRPQACVAAADLDPDGVHLLRAGDCEVWLPGPDGWRRAFARRIDTDQERARMLRWAREHPELPFLEYDRARPETSGIWTTAALGRLPQPTLQARRLRHCRELVVATDGARLRPQALRALPDWLGRMDAHPGGYPASPWETGPDDLAVVRVRSRR